MSIIAAGPIGPWLAVAGPSATSACDARTPCERRQTSAAVRAVRRTASALLLAAAAAGLALGLVDTGSPAAWGWTAAVSAAPAELHGAQAAAADNEIR